MPFTAPVPSTTTRGPTSPLTCPPPGPSACAPSCRFRLGPSAAPPSAALPFEPCCCCCWGFLVFFFMDSGLGPCCDRARTGTGSSAYGAEVSSNSRGLVHRTECVSRETYYPENVDAKNTRVLIVISFLTCTRNCLPEMLSKHSVPDQGTMPPVVVPPHDPNANPANPATLSLPTTTALGPQVLPHLCLLLPEPHAGRELGPQRLHLRQQRGGSHLVLLQLLRGRLGLRVG